MADNEFPTGTLMKGKRGLIMGVANKNSIAWGIAQQLAAQGAELAFSYQDDALERRVRPLVESLGEPFMIKADVTDRRSRSSCCLSHLSPTFPILMIIASVYDLGLERTRFLELYVSKV